MDPAHFRDDGTAEAGRAFSRESRRNTAATSNRTGRCGSHADRVEYVLRYPPLRRIADLPARRARRRAARAVERERVPRRFPRAGRRAPGDAYLRYPFAL